MKSEKLISDIQNSTNECISSAEKLKSKTEEELNWKQNSETWSILECLEHLNLYAKFYLPEIENAIQNAKSKPQEEFKSGFWGNYFAKSMLPKEKLNKMKTAKNKNPLNSKLDKNVIENFIAQQKEFCNLLEQAKNVDLNKEKTKISITNLIKLKLGDTFLFLNNHTFRHLKQIENIEKNACRQHGFCKMRG